MMEVDHISYIFGSFSRRRQSHDVSSPKRRSIDTSKVILHDRSKSAPHVPKTNDVVVSHSRTKSVCSSSPKEQDATVRYKCPVCQKHFLEPRVLPCLHTFCTKCLEELECGEVSNNESEESSGCGNGSGGSGYASDKLENSESPWTQQTSSKSILCPTCDSKCDLPPEGIRGLPPNYLIQHRMVLATLNAHTTKLLCDLCSLNVPAVARCTECALSLCSKCADVHKRQDATGKKQHEVLTLNEARKRGITKVRRQVMCAAHPEKELSVFCCQCSQVICRDCTTSRHRGHTVEPTGRAAKLQTGHIRTAVERAKCAAEKSSNIGGQLEAASKRLDSHCDRIQEEIRRFTEDYIRAVQEHQKNLYGQLHQAKGERVLVLEGHREELRRRLRDAEDAIRFADELLREGTDVELLSFVKPILSRLEMCDKLDELQELKVCENVQFLPEEVVQGGVFPMYGTITTQTVSPKHCLLHTEGLHNLRMGRRGEAVLETKDQNDEPLRRGGERVSAELRHREGPRTLQVSIEDKKDGSYRITFVPDAPGKLLLSVFVNGQHIKDSPFPIVVRTLRPHHGTFHCCSFCSSGGTKEASCGCGGRMPGGYRGCGHGHEGHPGRRHWSCCGNVLEHSECVRTNSITHYQFTL